MKDSSLIESPADRGGALPFCSLALVLIIASGAADMRGQQYFSDESGARLPGRTDACNHVLLVDVDSDGDLDLLVSNIGFPGALDRLLVNDGSGFFVDETMERLPILMDQTYSMTAGDFDSDGDVDLLSCNSSGGNCLLVNDGTGVFMDGSKDRLPEGHGSRIACAGDLDSDGDLDMVFLGFSEALLLVNDSRGYFSDETLDRFPVVGSEARAGLLEDFDLDGDLDLVVGFEGRPGVILENDGSGYFSAAGSLPASQDTMKTRGFCAGDMDGDGDMDLVEAGFTRGFFGDRVLISGGDLGFTDDTGSLFPVLPYNMDEGTSSIVADCDMDGYPDVFIAKYEQSLLLTGNLSGQYVDVTSERLPVDFSTISTWADCGDVDGDGDPDLVLSNLLQRNNVYINQSVADTVAPAVRVVVRPAGSVPPDEKQQIKLLASDGALCIESVRIIFSTDGEKYEQVSCRHLGGSLYAGEIPGQKAGTEVNFYAAAQDARTNTSTDPGSAPDSLYFFHVGGGVGTGEDDLSFGVPGVTGLLQNYPNPFNPYTIIAFTIGNEDVDKSGYASVALSVFDTRGRKVSDVFGGVLRSGRHTFTWTNRSGIRGGVYLIRLVVSDREFIKKAVLLP